MTKHVWLFVAILVGVATAVAQESSPTESRGTAPAGMVLVPGGKHRIGIDQKDVEALAARLGGNRIDLAGTPAYEVELEDFFIDVDEVTNESFDAFLRDTGRAAPKRRKLGEWPARQPVTGITYDDAEAFLEWCGKRMPTEFEWEAAARWKPPGDQTNRWWPWGDEFRAPESRPTGLAAVGSFRHDVSALGIRDLAGNAIEMTSSMFDSFPGGPPGPQFSGSLRVLRGGSWLANALFSMTTARKAMVVRSAELLGFRGARSRTRGKDLFESVAGSNQLTSKLEELGPPMPDEASGRPELALRDPKRFSALMAGGWDAAARLPSRARHIGVICRNTSVFPGEPTLARLVRDRTGPVMLGLLVTDVAFASPRLAAGKYWVLLMPKPRTETTGGSEIVLQALEHPGRRIALGRSHVSAYQGRRGPTAVTVVAPNEVAVLMSLATSDGAGLRIEIELAEPAGSLAEFR